MRTIGAKTIPKSKKARILAKKNTQEYTTREIAKQEGVCPKTVSNVTEYSLPPEVVEMSRRYREHFATYAEANAFKAEQRVFDDIDNISADKASKVAETQFNLARTIRGESTTNNHLSDEQLAAELFRRLINKYQWSKEEAMRVVSQDYPEIDTKLLTDA